MFAWIGKRIPQPWSRRTRWTPLLQNQREFQRTLSKERSRVDREGSYFGFVILRLTDLTDARGQTKRLARILHRRLRDTDEKGHLGYGRVGVMLAATGLLASEFVLEEILRLSRENGLAIEGEVFVYPGKYDQDDSKVGGAKHLEGTGEFANVDGMPVAPLAMMLPDYPAWKRALDVAGAVTGLVVATPFLILCAAIIKITSSGPVLYRQQRTGYLGEPFEIYKLRTMIINADELKAALRERNERDGPAFKMRRDPRITFVGRILRASGLDELPQLVNVLRGDMSLVGPRPLPVEEASQCSAWQRRREEVKPGLTCFWQLSKSRQIAFVDWMRLDLQYARSACLRLDVKLIAKTFTSVILGRVGH